VAKNEAGPRIYRYILETDDGMAPCVDGGLLTLATCKPVIRRVARPDDWVLGFLPGSESRGMVAWAARVDRKVEQGAFGREFRGRSDAVYPWDDEGNIVFLRPAYHPKPYDRKKDLSGPALIFDPTATWYFGDNPKRLPDVILHLAASGQNHRVNFRQPGDYRAMLDWLAAIGEPGMHGKPRHAPGPKSCGGKPAPKSDCGC
jgi:hypothetical protein